MKKRFWLSLLILVHVLSGCGYSTRSQLAGNIRTIHIAHFKNSINYTEEIKRQIYIPLLEVKIRNAIADRFLFDGRLKVNPEESADLILKGELTAFERVPLRFTDDEDVQEYRINVVVSLELWNADQKKVVWMEPSFVGETTYFTTGSQAKSENVALEDALTDLARRVVERTIEDW